MSYIKVPEAEATTLEEAIDKVIALVLAGGTIRDLQQIEKVRGTLRFAGSGIIELYNLKWRHGVRSAILEQVESELRNA